MLHRKYRFAGAPTCSSRFAMPEKWGSPARRPRKPGGSGRGRASRGVVRVGLSYVEVVPVGTGLAGGEQGGEGEDAGEEGGWGDTRSMGDGVWFVFFEGLKDMDGPFDGYGRRECLRWMGLSHGYEK